MAILLHIFSRLEVSILRSIEPPENTPVDVADMLTQKQKGVMVSVPVHEESKHAIAALDTQKQKGVEASGPIQEGKKSNIAVLDGVRAFAIFLVISFHINIMTFDLKFENLWLWNRKQYPFLTSLSVFGASGVNLFFVLSGFLLFLPYARALLFNTQWPSARQFYVKRVLRIVPGYYISLFLVIVLFQQQYLQPQHGPELLLFLTFFMDSSSLTNHHLNGPYWTLAVEWQFYMLLPLLTLFFLMVMRSFPFLKQPRQRLFAVFGGCLLIMAWGLFTRFAGLYFGGHNVQDPVLSGILFILYGCQGKYLEEFAIGMLLCSCYTYAMSDSYGLKLRHIFQKLSPLILLAGLALLSFMSIWHFNMSDKIRAFSYLDPITSYYDWLGEFLIAFGFALCILALLFGHRFLQALFAWRPLCLIGWISYGLYIWHLPWLILFHYTLLPQLLPPMAFDLSYALHWFRLLMVIVPIATLSYQLIEKPGVKLASWLMKGKWNFVSILNA
jgi:peptidoglycan/LPS O-acetylase OafA/YrhL